MTIRDRRKKICAIRAIRVNQWFRHLKKTTTKEVRHEFFPVSFGNYANSSGAPGHIWQCRPYNKKNVPCPGKNGCLPWDAEGMEREGIRKIVPCLCFHIHIYFADYISAFPCPGRMESPRLRHERLCPCAGV
ncbi:Uncharacterized protein dnm_008090 [Desulfonema magnum]|uniref:Uncharacterized protein n=1 Tax=Desulfonema magnum TaxID=45655 RepID=A0A975GKJ5_9BACT|nr:Uncharacterized protein dnm_008090 [Desulfonema magnum]